MTFVARILRGRTRGLDYGLFVLLTLLLLLVAAFLGIDVFVPSTRGAAIASVAVWVVVKTAWIVIGVRRLHDMNVTGWAILIAVLWDGFELVSHSGGPVTTITLLVFLLLTFWPGSKGTNRFGPDPRARSIERAA